MGSFTRKAGITAAAVTIGLGLTALPASADQAQDKAREKAFSKAIAKARQQEREVVAIALNKVKAIGKKRITNVSVPCTGTATANADALQTAFNTAVAQAATIYNIVLGTGCTFDMGQATAPAVMAVGAGDNVQFTGSSSTILADAAARHATVVATGVLRFYGVTVQGTGAVAGGGIDNAGTLSLYNSTMTANNIATAGGAATNTGDMAAWNSTFSSNISGANGGAIASTAGNLLLSNCTVTSNTAVTTGGGIHFANGIATLNSSLIQANSATTAGGGLYNGAMGLVNAYGSLWSGNSATTNGGGIASTDGFYGRSIGLTGNSAVVNGGGYYNTAGDTDAVLNLSSGYVQSNSAAAGGGIYNAGNVATQATVSGTTVSGNSPNNCVNATGCSV